MRERKGGMICWFGLGCFGVVSGKENYQAANSSKHSFCVSFSLYALPIQLLYSTLRTSNFNSYKKKEDQK
jgi:hypothetical protein